MVMAVATTPGPVKYINDAFSQIDSITKGRRKQEAKIIEEKLAKTE